ncbi:MAG: DUF1858 domain-containing protein [Lachnospiraceae bacterium]|nr:DUF1858 domain-containing protein [Lachnospiraceae bacterium]
MANETALEKKPLTGDMLIGDILMQYPEASYILMNCGMACISRRGAKTERKRAAKHRFAKAFTHIREKNIIKE